MHYTKVKPLIEQCGVVWEEGKNIQVGKKELSMFADLLVKEKELTDEEIKIIAYPFESVYTTYDKQTDTDTVHTRFDQLGFARALLRKAQEK